jgi:Cu/Ag efflux protein CusF
MTLNTKIKGMKKLRMTVLAVNLLAAPPVLAQSTMTDGLVIKIDQAAGKITIKHGPHEAGTLNTSSTSVVIPTLVSHVRLY